MVKKLYIFTFWLISTLSFSQNREANDCVNYIKICGNQTISLNPTGYGTQEISYYNTCNGSEHNSLWLKFTAKTTGTLGFDLIPTNTDITVDYDFWIFGPNATCGNLGQSIRCSTTNPKMAGSANNHTGMRDSEPNNHYFEGPGSDGDSYVKSLDVKVGESYFLVIDRPIGDGSFTLNWTGTAILEDPFVSTDNSFGTIDPITVCNSNLLYDFSSFTNNIINGNADFDVYYYKTYEDANYNQNRITQPETLENHNYYYRIQSKNSECFRVETIKIDWKPIQLLNPDIKSCKDSSGRRIFDLTSAILTNEATASTKYYLTLQEAQAHVRGTEIPNPSQYISNGGSVFAWLVSAGGCENSAEIFLKFYPTPNIDLAAYNANLCDSDLDDSVIVKFSDITPLIVKDYNEFIINYYLESNPNVALADTFSFNTDTSILLEVKSKTGCPSVFGTINFKIPPQITLNNVPPQEICNNSRSGKESIDLNQYRSRFTIQANNITFYETLNDAKKKLNNIPALQDLKTSRSFFIRFENSANCPSVGEMKFIFKNPKTSSILKDMIICKDNQIELDAGPGFESYLWDSGSTNQNSGLMSVGNHWVDLTFNGCITRQEVKLIAEEEVSIKILQIENDKLTVTATGGSTPYKYSLDGINWQASNVFDNLKKGTQRIYVRSAKKCSVAVREFSNINIANLITPNGDGKNDVLDYSDLKWKNNVFFKIFDRNGKSVFIAKNGNYIWDGKDNGRVIPSGSYWFMLEWIEPDSGVIYKYNSWILLKNR